MSEISRRKFIQLSVLGSAVTAAGCDSHNDSRYAPGVYHAEVDGTYGAYSNRVFPYITQPSGMDDGVPQYFATVCQMCSAGCGLYVRTIGGRALQIQGNPLHPISAGAVCSRGIGALQYLYNPDRLRFPKARTPRTNPLIEPGWAPALTQATQGLQASRGKVAVLVDGITIGGSPTLLKMANDFAKSVGGTLTVYSLLDDAPWRAAAKAVYGKDQVPAYQLDQADVIVSFSGDFLEAWPSPVLYGRQYGDFRQGPRRTPGQHGTFIYVGPRMSQTAANSDTWLPCSPGTEPIVAQAIAAAMTGGSVTNAAQASGLTEQQITSLADTFKAAGPRAVAVAGNGLMSSANATAAFTAVETLNVQAKSQCVGFGTPALGASAQTTGTSGYKAVQALVADMNAGKISALVLLGQPNPAFTLPAADGFAAATAKVPFILAITPFEDETTVYADVLLPSRTFLEEWGDNEPTVIPAGTTLATLQQPIVDPKFIGGDGSATNDLIPFVPWMDTLPLGELLVTLAKNVGKPMPEADTLTAVRTTWAGTGQADMTQSDINNDTKWVNAVATGGLWTNPAGAQAASTAGAGGAGTSPAGTPPAASSTYSLQFVVVTSLYAQADVSPAASNTYSLQVYPSIYWTDGRGANIPWHQDIAEPMTMAVWNSWVEINLQTAEEHGIRTGDIVRLTSPYGSIDIPAVPSPGIHPGAVAVPIGQGHTAYGRYATGRGANPLAILNPVADSQTGALAYCATQVTLTKVSSALPGFNGKETLVITQDMPGGAEPEEVMKLIHDTAKERKAVGLKQA